MKGMASAGTKSKVYILLTIIYIIALCYSLPIDNNRNDNVFPDHLPLPVNGSINNENNIPNLNVMNKTITTVYNENLSISVDNGTNYNFNKSEINNTDDVLRIKNNLTNFSNLHENGDKIIVSVKVTSSSGEKHSEFISNPKRHNEENLRFGKELLQAKEEQQQQHHVTVATDIVEKNNTEININGSQSDNGYEVYFPNVPESLGDGHDLEETDQHDSKYFTSQEDSNADSTNYHYVVASPYPTSDYSKIEPSQGTNTGTNSNNNNEKEQIPYQALIVINNNYKETSAQPRSISYNSMLQSVSEVKLWSDYKSYSSTNDKIENKTENQQRPRSRSESNSFLDRKFNYDHHDSSEQSITSKYFNKNLNHGKFNVTKSPQFTRKIIFNLDRLPYDLLNAPIQDRGSISASDGLNSESASLFSSATENNSLNNNNFGKSSLNNEKLQHINRNKESVNYLYTQIHPLLSQYKEKHTNNNNPDENEERHYKILITPRPDNLDSTSYQYSKTSSNDVTSLENTVSPSYFTDPPRNHHINTPIGDPDKQQQQLNNIQEISGNKNNYNADDVDINSSPIDNDSHKVGFVIEGLNYRKYRIEEKTSEGFIVGEYGVVSNNDGSLRGVRYTADSNINPRLIQETLLKFLSL